MGFTRPDPELFAAYSRTRRALLHMEEFLRAVEMPLLQALREARGAGEDKAALYWGRGRKLARTRIGGMSIPFRVPADSRSVRVRAGVMSWNPPVASFFVRCSPDQRWDRRLLLPGYTRPLIRAEDYVRLLDQSTFAGDRVR